jgi:hypothetical protein
MIRRLDDIERDRKKEEKNRIKKEMANDTVDVINNIISALKTKEAPREKSKILTLLKIIGLIILILVGVNFILFNFWLLRFFIRAGLS